jgi:hypothetical protein
MRVGSVVVVVVMAVAVTVAISVDAASRKLGGDDDPPSVGFESKSVLVLSGLIRCREALFPRSDDDFILEQGI